MVKKRLLSIVIALALLLSLVPLTAIPVSAAGERLVMYLVDPLTGDANDIIPDSGYDVTGSIVEVWAVDSSNNPLSTTLISGWSLLDVVPVTTNSTFVPGGPKGAVNPVRVQGDWGETIIQCTLTNGTTLTIDKKWGKIDHTEISGPQSIYVTWVEEDKVWIATASVTDVVIGDFVNEFEVHSLNPVQGVILNWYLVHGTPAINMGPAEAPVLKAAAAGLQDAIFANFVGNGTYIQTISNGSGSSTVQIETDGEEAITVVVVPEYPIPIQLDVVTEVTTINFWTREMEKVPQVRWAGEKIVLEKNWGEGFSRGDYLVRYHLENQSPGALEAIGDIISFGYNLVNTNDTVWTEVNSDGLSQVVLVSEDMGEVDVGATLYYVGEGDFEIENQHGFVVYYLKLESLKLMNVVGKRSGHNTGDWEPSNPWDDSLTGVPPKNELAQTLNVSQDTLLRARVKGWFTNSNPSVRPQATLDIDNDGTPDLTLPYGRWVLPDDWAALAGPLSTWRLNRGHWDIMDNPFDAVDALNPLGAYDTRNLIGGTVNTTQDVIGPFSPGIELMTPLGWNVQFPSPDSSRVMRTVVPNNVLEWWDAPMPPAKIIFSIKDVTVIGAGGQDIGNSGYFKDADKTGIYYIGSPKKYTNPFYEQMIPAHEEIPAFINNGGYDWDSFDSNYGPYEFWTIINRPNVNAEVPTADPAGHPTRVEVYSDNHGEAMVYLNGDWNLNLTAWGVNGAADVSPGATVGSTTVQAMADYPYLRKHQPILSNSVVKTWLWGGLVLGTDSHLFLDGVIQANSLIINTTGTYTITTPGGPNWPDDVGTSDKKMVWLWLTDRDGLQAGVLGAKVAWEITGGGNSVDISSATGSLSLYNPTMTNILMGGPVGPTFSEPGFLAGTKGKRVPALDDTHGVSWTRAPTSDEKDLFNKYYPGYNADNFVVAGIEIQTTDMLLDVVVSIEITSPDYNGGFGSTTITRTANVDFGASYPLDDEILRGDANVDGVVNMGDVTSVELGILGLQAKIINADANGDGVINMADVIKIERKILGLP